MKKASNEFLSGKKLYGDNFNLKQIKEWYADEKEGYSDLISPKKYYYGYHELNKKYGYNKLKNIKKYKKVLGFGSAYGHELHPILQKIWEIHIVEPSKKLRLKTLEGKKLKYIEPSVSGKLPYKDNSFDLITCFGVLHHIPNVSKVLSELFRVLEYGGYILIREPIVSMGDWTKKRFGLTKRERGIPLEIFRKIISEHNMKIISEDLVLFPLTRRLELGGKRACNSKVIVWIDEILSKLFSWNNKYHSIKFYHKIRPQSVFFVLRK